MCLLKAMFCRALAALNFRIGKIADILPTRLLLTSEHAQVGVGTDCRCGHLGQRSTTATRDFLPARRNFARRRDTVLGLAGRRSHRLQSTKGARWWGAS